MNSSSQTAVLILINEVKLKVITVMIITEADLNW